LRGEVDPVKYARQQAARFSMSTCRAFGGVCPSPSDLIAALRDTDWAAYGKCGHLTSWDSCRENG
jgi:hypothetical protein